MFNDYFMSSLFNNNNDNNGVLWNYFRSRGVSRLMGIQNFTGLWERNFVNE
jgi:hypothetical protein